MKTTRQHTAVPAPVHVPGFRPGPGGLILCGRVGVCLCVGAWVHAHTKGEYNGMLWIGLLISRLHV
jgi:hypothetical protein